MWANAKAWRRMWKYNIASDSRFPPHAPTQSAPKGALFMGARALRSHNCGQDARLRARLGAGRQRKTRWLWRTRRGRDESRPLHGRLPECKCRHCARARVRQCILTFGLFAQAHCLLAMMAFAACSSNLHDGFFTHRGARSVCTRAWPACPITVLVSCSPWKVVQLGWVLQMCRAVR